MKIVKFITNNLYIYKRKGGEKNEMQLYGYRTNHWNYNPNICNLASASRTNYLELDSNHSIHNADTSCCVAQKKRHVYG
ncbi:MAG: hypothetical protein G01um101493_352 [Microgenomates group bacterium Gr01-1014_93]|nr:MAG: hypothetical protein G01um101493_352 [Microgenomates group bacterium Gr01-1014_93]